MNLKKITLFIIVVIILFTLSVIGLFTLKAPKNNIYVNTSQTAVIKQMRSLNRLETASFTIEKIIEAGTKDNVFKEFLFGDRILLIAHGEVVAGFDLSKVTSQDIVVSGTTLNVTLPSPEILFVRLDNAQTRVYDRKRGILNQDNKDLESTARLAAENSIRAAACKEDIFLTATQNAKKQLTALFTSLGFVDITIIVPPTECK